MLTSSPVLAGFLGGSEMWIIGLLALLFFGASRLPGVARSLGQSVNEFKAGIREGKEEEAAAKTDVRKP
jgi:sec-independent protein translocase protein TatA